MQPGGQSKDFDARFTAELVAALPQIEAYAVRLCRNRHLAEDMSQTAAARAWAARRHYELGTSMTGWLLHILRNCVRSHFRHETRKSDWSDDLLDGLGSEQPSQDFVVELHEVQRALATLRAPERHAVVATGLGFSQHEVAALLRCRVGTAKSRTGRGRRTLQKTLEGHRSLSHVPPVTFRGMLLEMNTAPAG
jgi:RNA polymerase sigma-70 factor (ECF subfamily)